MKDEAAKSLSKYLSLLLRHKPDTIGLTLDSHGWADISELVEKSGRHGRTFSVDDVGHVVATNDKQRFSLSDDGTRIRANQGHSFQVDLNLLPSTPPRYLYHGTVEKFVGDIQNKGLEKMNRQYVHLSPETDTAEMVGSRRGKPILLRIRARAMHDEGHVFYHSENGVWLTDRVPPEYIEFKRVSGKALRSTRHNHS